FPGGPAVERLAEQGDETRFDLPRPLLNRPGLDMSFAGLKTAGARIIQTETLDEQGVCDLCASYQRAVSDCLAEKTRRALVTFSADKDEPIRVVVAGGVAANLTLRQALDDVANDASAQLIAPPLKYCTDNAAMIALAGAERLRAGCKESDALDFAARSRWPLDETAASNDPVFGGGKRGAKA
ncbi:MAG: tRNA (adenosine(37)-N6)-threonylcarbamoyltransferase complex transferase subunit TsaD, partial [Pseudomonadota bacterium]